ncbi:REP-associated tyrosine transposase [Acidithiobacillus sp.]
MPALLADARMLAWVLMPDHVHWLLQLGAATPIDELVIRLKSASARQVNRVLARTGPLWSTAYHDHVLREEDDLRAAARYLIANPLRAGLVQRVGDYPFWDAVCDVRGGVAGRGHGPLLRLRMPDYETTFVGAAHGRDKTKGPP